MKMDCNEQTVQIFGKPVNLQKEWQKVAGQLGSICEGNRYIEYDKEIARLRARLLHLQEEADGFRTDNKNLSSMNDGLVEKVKDLISMQDNQLEHYSTALVLLTEERKELCHSLSSFQKRIRQLEKQVAACKCRNGASKDSSDDTDSLASSQDAGTNTDNTEEVASRIRRNLKDYAEDGCEFVEPLPAKTKNEEHLERHIESMESSYESKQCSMPSTPKAKGSFVNSMIQKLEKSDKITKKYKLKSFEEPKPKGAEELILQANRTIQVGFDADRSDDAESIPDSVPESVLESLPDSVSDAEVDALKCRVTELQLEVTDLRDTCQSLTCMLERTYDDMQSSSLERDDTKDQLIACLRARLLEAICDLMKVEKRDVKSVACGSSLPRIHKHPEPSAPTLDLFSSKSDPIVSPSKSKVLSMLQSPKFKALREDNYNKLRKLSCWKPHAPDESA